ncbi:hypothetical protein CK556_00020 [Mesoplasma chauliocola]|uniref:Pilus assembly protein PilM n=1 Tax=Mesoplasma chauliocola TaxID=216427 RepID=A0A249SMD5_9MOLU|nr:rod shape-determining protein [Mesoplasma chauliocola]ASZ08757.1 hypothetical protein CK556_00020 [Mesoplasma chauliocola]
MSNKKIGIVFGEEFTRIISSEKGKIYDDFSLVCWNVLTTEIVLYGRDVKNTIGRLDDPLKVVNILDKYVIQDLEIFKSYVNVLIEKFKDEFNEADIVIACPNSDNDFIQEFFKTIFNDLAKINSLTFAPRIVLSALGANADINDEYGVLILDIHQAYAKVALIVEGEIIKEKETIYAEKYLDEALNQFIKEEYSISVDSDMIEKIKWSLGTIIKLRDELELSIVGKDIITNERRSVVCVSEEFKKIFIKSFTNYKSLIISVLENSSALVRSGVVKNGIYVTGELSGISGVKDFFEDFFNFPVTISKKRGYSDIEGSIKFLNFKK